jgi:hypothetical protein
MLYFLKLILTATQSRCWDEVSQSPRYFRPSTGQYFDFVYLSRPCNEEGGSGGGIIIPDAGGSGVNTSNSGLSGTASSGTINGNGTNSGNSSTGSAGNGDAVVAVAAIILQY